MNKGGQGIFFLVCLIIILALNGVFAQDTAPSEPSPSPSPESPSIPEPVIQDNTLEDDEDEERDDEDVERDEEEVSDEDNEEDEVNDDEDEEIYEDIEEDAQLEETAGITPDSALYVIDDFFERTFVGDNPERALAYKEEKIAEAQEMIRQGKREEAHKVLEKAEKYSNILEKEVSPEIEKRTRRSSKAIKNVLDNLEDDLEGDEWKDIREKIEKHKEKEDKIATAAKLSAKIKELCESLSALDPLEYSRACRTKDSAPRWQRDLDKDLTEEQKKEAREFFETLSQCFQNPQECKCEDIKITAFAEKCEIIAPLAAKCDEGDEDACDEMDEIEDPIDLLPPHLQDVMERVEERYGEAQFELHMPEECREAGATGEKECREVMFRENAPEECIEAFDQGKLDFENEREARQQCERIMFEANAPPECIEAGAKTHQECGKIMFQQHAPEECVEAGLTGESRADERKCREIMKELGREGRGPGRGPPGFNVDCRRIQDSNERLKCYDNALEGARNEFEEHQEFRDFKQFEREGFEARGPQGNWPRQCIEAGATNDPEACRRVMEEWGRQQHEQNEQDRQEFRPPEFRPPEGEFREGEFHPPEGFRPPEGEFRPPEGYIPPEGEFRPPEGYIPPEGTQQTAPPPSESAPPPSEPTPTQTTESSGSSSTGSGETSPSTTTGSVIAVDNAFAQYYFS